MKKIVASLLTVIMICFALASCFEGEFSDTVSSDIGSSDTESSDTVSSDIGSSDTESSDTVSSDTGSLDTESSGTGSSDTGSLDTESSDTGSLDTESSGTGSSDTGSSDIGSSDTDSLDTDSIDTESSAIDSSDTEESSDETTTSSKNTESEKEDEFVPPADQGAKLVGFRTEASTYNGPFDSSGWKAAGMGYFIRTESGSLIVIDGGNTEDALRFYKLLKKYSLTEHITVDYWILTHPHSDHVNCLIEMTEYKYMMEGMTIKNLVYDFPTKLKDDTDASDSIYYKEKFDSIAQQIGANVIQPQKNQKIELSDATIEFLYVPSTANKSFWGATKYEYESLTNINQLSLIFTVTTSKKIMFTGDAFERSLESVANAYRLNSSALDCDILQMPHHFLCDTGHEGFYNKVNAETLLLPACKSGYEAMKSSDEYKDNPKNKINLAAESKAEKVYKAFEGNFEIDI